MITKIRPATFRYIESEVFNYQETLEQIRLREEELLNQPKEKGNPEQGENSVRMPSQQTENDAIRLVTDDFLNNMKKTVSAINEAYRLQTMDKKQVLELHYCDKKQWADIASLCNIHRNTAMKIRRDFVYVVAELLNLY